MIEPIMYFGVGFLVAALIGLVVIPLVHGRAVRLTMRRLEAATPLSMAEIQADKDQLRAEFAMSTRRLEMSVEQLKNRTTSQLSELSKKTDAINRLKVELGEKTATIFALEARDKALRDQLRASEDEFTVRTAAVQDAERALNDKHQELAKMVGELDERSVLTDSQKIEIIALKTQVEALKERLNDAEKDVKTTEDRVAHERIDLKEATAELAAERGKVENLGGRVSELEQQLIAQTTEAELLGRRAHDLEARLSEQGKALAESEFELKQLRERFGSAQKTEADLRTAIAEIDGKAASANETIKSEKIQLQAELERANEERVRLSREVTDMKRETEQAWSSERVENALLRERINDVAAEVARLASALEGPDSTIDAILAAESVRDKANIPVRATGINVEVAAQEPAGGNLADRIRALQSRASRIQTRDEPTRN
jgi:chromosome segregation ATPase